MSATGKVVRPLTGWHVLAMFVAFFGVIIAVNITMAWKAISTFPGLEVENGYVASQSFDAEMAAQKGAELDVEAQAMTPDATSCGWPSRMPMGRR